jgi:hypothetical protein
MKILLVMRIPKHKILFMMVTMKLVVNRQFPIQNILLVAILRRKYAQMIFAVTAFSQ